VIFGIRGCVFDKDNVICENGISSLRAAEAFEQLDASKIPLKEENRDPRSLCHNHSRPFLTPNLHANLQIGTSSADLQCGPKPCQTHKGDQARPPIDFKAELPSKLCVAVFESVMEPGSDQVYISE